MEPDRESKLRAIKVGDIFHAEARNFHDETQSGASLLCQALVIGDTTIEAQRMFMRNEILHFDRTTGLEEGKKGVPSKPLAPLPGNIPELILRVFMLTNVYLVDGKTVIEDEEKAAPAKINSVTSLPEDIRDILLKLDHRNRTSNDPGSAKLSEPEKRALIFVQHHFRNNQI